MISISKYNCNEIWTNLSTIRWRFGLGVQRTLWFVVGCTALALGALGAVLPVLPTTPFVILAAFAFGKSTPRVQAWLETSRIFGPVIADWKVNGAIAPRFKAIAIVMMGAVFSLSVAMGLAPLILVVQAVCITGAAAFIFSRPNGPG